MTNPSDSPAKSTAKLTQSLNQHLTKTLADAAGHLDADGPEGALARGKVYQLSGYFEEAADSYAGALQSEKHADEATARLVVTQLLARQPEKALAHATNLASRNPRFEFEELTSGQRISALTLLGDALVYDGNLTDAIDAYKRARSESPKDSAAVGRLAQAYLAAGTPQEAFALSGDVSDNPRFRRLSVLLEAGQRNPSVLPPPGVDTMVSFVRGRPILVDEVPVVAPIVRGDDQWCADVR